VRILEVDRGFVQVISPRTYILVTPTKDEEALIGETIASVVAQSVRPLEWVIVSDGSTDATNELVRKAASVHPWIRLLELPPRVERDFANVVRATSTGIRGLRAKDYSYIGLLDSDVRFKDDYFERVMVHFENSPDLGLAGGVVIDVDRPPTGLPQNRQDVPGAVQFFRRTCFEAIGSLVAVPEGGWDGLACTQARMAGFETRLLVDLVVDHLKPRNISEGNVVRRHWQMGVRDYAVGYHPVFEIIKCFNRVFESPLLIGSIAWVIGYWSAALQRRKRVVPADLIQFLRLEQKRRLRRSFLGLPKFTTP
jgi:biofilm PGA synthesis N-glycosyltransferase PgaC